MEKTPEIILKLDTIEINSAYRIKLTIGSVYNKTIYDKTKNFIIWLSNFCIKRNYKSYKQFLKTPINFTRGDIKSYHCYDSLEKNKKFLIILITEILSSKLKRKVELVEGINSPNTYNIIIDNINSGEVLSYDELIYWNELKNNELINRIQTLKTNNSKLNLRNSNFKIKYK